MNPVILFRESLSSKDEIEIANKYFDVAFYHADIVPGSTVIGRYSVLPFYDWIHEDIFRHGSALINSVSQHKYIADLEYYTDVSEFTFETWFDAYSLRDDDAPFVIKGKTNSKKHDWNKCMFAPTKLDAIKMACELQTDSLIGQQDIIYRKYHKLRTFEIGINGIPFTNEWRFFVYKGTIVSSAYYWSNADNAEELNDAGVPEKCTIFANRIIDILKNKLNFYVIDIAEKENGEWILVEVNDGQMSGLSMNDPDTLYKNLSHAIKSE